MSRTMGIVTLCALVCASAAQAQAIRKHAAERHNTTIYRTLFGIRMGTIYDGTNIPPCQWVRASGGRLTDRELVQRFLGVAYNRTTSTSVAMVTGTPGNYTMEDLVAALSNPPFDPNEWSYYPDLASLSEDIYVVIDIDDFYAGGGVVPPLFTTLDVANGQVMNYNMPGLLVSTMPFAFSVGQGWTSTGLLTGQVDVIGEIALIPEPGALSLLGLCGLVLARRR